MMWRCGGTGTCTGSYGKYLFLILMLVRYDAMIFKINNEEFVLKESRQSPSCRHENKHIMRIVYQPPCRSRVETRHSIQHQHQIHISLSGWIWLCWHRQPAIGMEEIDIPLHPPLHPTSLLMAWHSSDSFWASLSSRVYRHSSFYSHILQVHFL